MIGDYSGTIGSGYVVPFNDGVIVGLMDPFLHSLQTREARV